MFSSKIQTHQRGPEADITAAMLTGEIARGEEPSCAAATEEGDDEKKNGKKNTGHGRRTRPKRGLCARFSKP